jgi:hypothetical protein
MKYRAATRRISQLLVFLFLLAPSGAPSETKPTVSIDLMSKGLPSGFFGRYDFGLCRHTYLGYRSVRWISTARLLVAFNTTPDCSRRARRVEGNLRLMTFDLRGIVLNSTDLQYEAGEGILTTREEPENDGIWIGPQSTVLVNFPGVLLKTSMSQPRLVIFSPDLLRIQEVIPKDSIKFEGVTADHNSVVFEDDHPRQSPDRIICLLYSGTPLVQTGHCPSAKIDEVRLPHLQGDPFAVPVPEGYFAFPIGRSLDGTRVAAFATKESALCELAGIFCPSHGKLVVGQKDLKSPLFSIDLSYYGRADVSPDGKYVAVFDKNAVRIFALPPKPDTKEQPRICAGHGNLDCQAPPL